MTENDRISNDNDDNNSNSSVVQEATIIRPKRRNRIPKRELCKKEIRRLRITEGLSINEISERTSIPEKSVRRYLIEIYQHERDVLVEPTPEELSCQVAQFKENTEVQIRQVLEIANDPDVEAADRMMAHEWVANARWSMLKLSYQSLTEISRHLQLYDNVRFIQKQKEEERQAMIKQMEQKALPNFTQDLQ